MIDARILDMRSKNGMITTALMWVIVTVVTIALIVLPVVTTKFHIQRYLAVEYKYSNSEMMMLELLAYPDIRHELGLYVSDLKTNDDAASGTFDRDVLKTKVSGVLDKLVPDGGCYALYYGSPSGSEDSWATILARDKAADGSVCKTADLLSKAKAFVPLPQGSAQIMLVLKTL
jgi:hypothetical protein